MEWLLGSHWYNVSIVTENFVELWSVPVTVGEVGGDVEDGLLASLHGDNTLIPSADDTSDTDSSDEVTTANGGIEPGDIVSKGSFGLRQ